MVNKDQFLNLRDQIETAAELCGDLLTEPQIAIDMELIPGNMAEINQNWADVIESCLWEKCTNLNFRYERIEEPIEKVIADILRPWVGRNETDSAVRDFLNSLEKLFGKPEAVYRRSGKNPGSGKFMEKHYLPELKTVFIAFECWVVMFEVGVWW